MVKKTAITINNVKIEFSLFTQGLPSIKMLFIELLKGRSILTQRKFVALDGVSFKVPFGETIGIIGHNGAGKSTILKVISGIFEPIEGSVSVNGKIAPIIELNAGFDDDLTGRENAYLNGALLGMSRKEMDEKIDAIIDFTGLQEFIDVPLKAYSSGMKIKLGFAVATEVNPDILIIDEVLAVGDVNFREKSYQRIKKFKKQGKTIVFVSHDLDAVKKFCSRVIVLHHGKLVFDGSPIGAIKLYHKIMLKEQ